MDIKLINKIEAIIRNELSDAELYRKLAQIAPNETQKKLMLEIAADEQAHADEFKLIYRDLTGEIYRPNIEPIDIDTSYEDILRDRVIVEADDFRRYMYEYQEYFTDESLREAFYLAAIDENVHALKLLDLLEN